MSLENSENNNIAWLYTPPLGGIDPPVTTRSQTLPFENIRWDDFEKLCYRLALLESNIESCRQYGVQGDEQHGIDIFARGNDFQKYLVYQCKNERDFGPQKIKDAVEKFIKGDWYVKSSAFVLCTSESLQTRVRLDAIEEQSKILSNDEKSLIVWDRAYLSTKLKEHPELIDDFFGRAWVEQFCGREAAISLSNRLDVQQLAELRLKLSSLYDTAFNSHDPGIPIPKLVPLFERCIIPDIEDHYEITSPMQPQKHEEAGELSADGADSLKDGRGKYSFSQKRNLSTTRHYNQRIPFQNWAAKNNRSLIFGDPGSGKTTLLRFLTLDLLSNNPLLGPVAEKWGLYLPIWIPFALWTKMISDRGAGDPGLKGIICQWLKAWNSEDLVPLVEYALKDKRVVLLIDGLDEYSDKSSARIALNHLEHFLKENKEIPVIATSRPQGFKKLGKKFEDWSEAEISPLSSAQQRELASIWFAANSKKIVPSLEKEQLILEVNRQADIFFRELKRSNELRQLSNNPLLLSLLIYLQISNIRLPLSRFDAYASLVAHLITEHPLSRVVAAEAYKDPGLSSESIKNVLSNLAYVVHEKYTEGLIEEDAAEKAIISFLKDGQIGLGMDHPSAVEMAKKTILIAEDDLGLIVKKSKTEISFFHRTLQEYLAAYNIHRLSTEEQSLIIDKHCVDPQWREVILGLFQITKRPKDVEDWVKIIRKKSISFAEKLVVDNLLSEVVFGNFNCPPDLSRELSEYFFRRIENSSWSSHRERLLKNTLYGLESPTMKELVQQKIRVWFPDKAGWNRQYLYKAMATWAPGKDVQEALFYGLSDETEENRSAAAQTLGTFAKGNGEIRNRLIEIINYTDSPHLLSAAVEALLVGYPEYSGFPIILDRLISSPMPDHQIIGIQGKVELGINTDKELSKLLVLGDENHGTYFFSGSNIVETFIKGWPQSSELKKKCFLSLGYGMYRREDLSRTLSLDILFKGYPMDDEVAEYCIQELRRERSFALAGFENFRMLSKNFKGHQKLIDALDDWVEDVEHRDVEVCYAALIGRTDKFKKKLIKDLKPPFPHWAAKGLLEGWGMKDPDVREALLDFVMSSDGNASSLGHLLPEIIEDKKECKNILLKAIKNPECERYDFVIQGFLKLGNTENDAEVVDIALPILDQDETMFSEGLKGGLIEGYSHDSRIRNMALETLAEGCGSFSAVAYSFGADLEIRKKILEIVSPLPVFMRLIIAKYLSEAEIDNDFAISVLSQYDQERDSEVKVQASIGYHTRLMLGNKDTTAALERLKKTIICIGPDMSERRLAAFCGLVVLEKIEVFNEVQRKGEPEGEASIDSIPSLNTNVPHIQLVLENWDFLKGSIKNDFWSRLFRFGDRKYFIWKNLAQFADKYPSPKKELLEFLSENNPKVGESETLLFLSRVVPRSSLLWEYCLNTMGLSKSHASDEKQDPDVNIGYQDEETAAAIIRSHFGNDEKYLKKLDVKKNKQHVETLIRLLSYAWPDSNELKELLDEIKSPGRRISENTSVIYSCIRSDPIQMFRGITKSLRVYDRTPRFARYNKHYPPIVERLQKDEALSKILIRYLNICSRPSEKVSISRLIFFAHGLTPGLKKWIEKELVKQLSGNGVETGFDMTRENFTSVPHTFLDILQSD